MATLNKRVEMLEALKKMRTQKRTLPDPAEHARRGQWFGNTLEAVCGPCAARTDDGSGVIINGDLLCSVGHYPLMCEPFKTALLARADNEADEDEKRELLKLHSWLTGGRLR